MSWAPAEASNPWNFRWSSVEMAGESKACLGLWWRIRSLGHRGGPWLSPSPTWRFRILASYQKRSQSFLFGGPENTHSNDYIYIYIYITKEALAEAAAFAQSNSSLQPTHPRRPKHQCQRATFRGGLGPRTLDSRDIWSIGFIIPGHMQNIQIIFSMVLY